MWSSCLSLLMDLSLGLTRWLVRVPRPVFAPVYQNLTDHHCHQLVQSHCWRMLVKRWVCGELAEEVWRAWGVGEASSPLMTLRETLCCSLTFGHWEKTCARHCPRLESCPDSAL